MKQCIFEGNFFWFQTLNITYFWSILDWMELKYHNCHSFIDWYRPFKPQLNKMHPYFASILHFCGNNIWKLCLLFSTYFLLPKKYWNQTKSWEFKSSQSDPGHKLLHDCVRGLGQWGRRLFWDHGPSWWRGMEDHNAMNDNNKSASVFFTHSLFLPEKSTNSRLLLFKIITTL